MFWISEKKNPDRVCLDTQEEKVCTHLAVMQWSAVCSGLSCLEQLPLHGQEQGINYYLRDVCMDTRKSNECRLTLLQRGLFKCLENHLLPIFICFFAISLCSGLLTKGIMRLVHWWNLVCRDCQQYWACPFVEEYWISLLTSDSIFTLYCFLLWQVWTIL